jgi:hypothetical protein
MVSFDRRSHKPILREVALERAGPLIPWLGNRTRIIAYQGCAPRQ